MADTDKAEKLKAEIEKDWLKLRIKVIEYNNEVRNGIR